MQAVELYRVKNRPSCVGEVERPGPKYEMFRTLGDYYRLSGPVKAQV
jgi:hypothetical protein